ncbi:MAG: MgtE intracellular region [Synergistaceae bacterium]|jgi:flagellar motility protein MotE (MotC chaperone)|nr:MgtE intracellular region [Synergistaceae bacterium]
MAEERREGRFSEREREERPDGERQASAPVSKKKKKRSRISLLFLLLLLAFGVGTGLHFSGLWDARPLVWSVIPQIPYLGQPVARFFRIPEQYTLTVAERRAFELTEWQKRLDERERELARRELNVESISGDLGQRAERLAGQETSARQTTSREAENAASDAEKKLMEQVARTYQDMSPRNAAQVVEQLTEGLAVDLLQKLPVDARASILGKMDPRKAARLTELMAISPR